MGADSAGMSNDIFGLNPNRRKPTGFDATIDGVRVRRPLRKRWQPYSMGILCL